MDDLNFTGNSKIMFEEVCNATPWLFRHFTRNGLVKGLKEEGCGQVTEETMYKVCKQVTPEKHLALTMEILDKHKSSSS
jgi:hypothetical protein